MFKIVPAPMQLRRQLKEDACMIPQKRDIGEFSGELDVSRYGRVRL